MVIQILSKLRVMSQDVSYRKCQCDVTIMVGDCVIGQDLKYKQYSTLKQRQNIF